jgi:hypothetical protein
MVTKTVSIIALIIALLGAIAITANASLNDEPFEFENYNSYGGSKDGTFSLSYAGRGSAISWDKCDRTDYVFRVNINRSYSGSDWKLYSGTGRYQRTPSGRVPYGYNLDKTDAHLCIGGTEFNSFLHPFGYWTVQGVESNVYTWRR